MHRNRFNKPPIASVPSDSSVSSFDNFGTEFDDFLSRIPENEAGTTYTTTETAEPTPGTSRRRGGSHTSYEHPFSIGLRSPGNQRFLSPAAALMLPRLNNHHQSSENAYIPYRIRGIYGVHESDQPLVESVRSSFSEGVILLDRRPGGADISMTTSEVNLVMQELREKNRQLLEAYDSREDLKRRYQSLTSLVGEPVGSLIRTISDQSTEIGRLKTRVSQLEEELLAARTLKEYTSQSGLAMHLRSDEEYIHIPRRYVKIRNPLNYAKIKTPDGECFIYPQCGAVGIAPQGSFVEIPPCEPKKQEKRDSVNVRSTDTNKTGEDPIPATSSSGVEQYKPKPKNREHNNAQTSTDRHAQLRIEHGVTTDAPATTQFEDIGETESGAARASSYHFVRKTAEERPVALRLTKVGQSLSCPTFR